MLHKQGTNPNAKDESPQNQTERENVFFLVCTSTKISAYT